MVMHFVPMKEYRKLGKRMSKACTERFEHYDIALDALFINIPAAEWVARSVGQYEPGHYYPLSKKGRKK